MTGTDGCTEKQFEESQLFPLEKTELHQDAE